MTDDGLDHGPKQPRHRRTARARLTMLYAGLYLVAGSVFLAVVYALVANNVANVNSRAPDSQLVEQCKAALTPLSTGKSGASASADFAAKCKAALSQAATIGVKSQHSQTLHHLLVYGIGALLLTTALAALLGWFVAGRILRPVHAITATARRASEEDLSDRIRLQGPHDELRELADTFDSMLDRLDAAFASQRRFVANASHELRTPLTVMRTAIDVTLAKPDPTEAQLKAMALSVREACAHADRLIEALLTLARSERGVTSDEPADLAVLTEDALDAAESQIGDRHLSVETDLGSAPARGDPVLLQRMVGNLVDNAVQHNVDHGRIVVRTGTDGDITVLRIENTCDHIELASTDALFEPFSRRDSRIEANGGVGLGLSIVRSVAVAHGGRVAVATDEPGQFAVTVFLSQ